MKSVPFPQAFSFRNLLSRCFPPRVLAPAVSLCLGFHLFSSQGVLAGEGTQNVSLVHEGEARTYLLKTESKLRDEKSQGGQLSVCEDVLHPRIRTGNLLFDGLYAMAVAEAKANSVSAISDNAYSHGQPIAIEAFKTGELWDYVWTRDISYSVYLALANFDPPRAANSLLFKVSKVKPGITGEFSWQVVQDTGSGGSYPVSTDRVVWALGAEALLNQLSGKQREEFLAKCYPVLHDTLEQDRHVIFDPRDGLYRGEQSFLDWREQTYPAWTANQVLAIAMSKAFSTNAGMYGMMKLAASCAGELGLGADQARYQSWAAELKRAMLDKFFDPKANLFSAYLLSEDGSNEIRVARYDLLGQSLAILLGVVDRDRARKILASYPVGPHGPAVVWPQERGIPIYHNQAVWPFATAFWIKAAKFAGNSEAVDAGIESLSDLAARNLSNMENYDFVTGGSKVEAGSRRGPVIDSRRQLWSVAGYLSMVQDIVFGLEANSDSLRFNPFITAKMRNETFAGTDILEMRGLAVHNQLHRIKIHLPPRGPYSHGVCRLERVELNGRPVTTAPVHCAQLREANCWDLFLGAPENGPKTTLRFANVADEASYLAPDQPQWTGEGVGSASGHAFLSFQGSDSMNRIFSIFRDGKLCAKGLRETKWTDPKSGENPDQLHVYQIAAFDPKSGFYSHLSPQRTLSSSGQLVRIPASAMDHKGGNLVQNHHFENWGKRSDEIEFSLPPVGGPGNYSVRAEFSNGSGPVNTGITCGVKKLEVLSGQSGSVVASGYLVMPQSGDWNRYELSSSIRARLEPSKAYRIRLSEDEYSRNMSYLQSNVNYTANPGGGPEPYNFVNIASVQLRYLGH